MNKEGYKAQIEATKKIIAEKNSDKSKKDKEKIKELKDLDLLVKRLEEED